MPNSPGAWMRAAALTLMALTVSACAANVTRTMGSGENNTHSEIAKLKCTGDDRQGYNADNSEVDRHIVNPTSIGDLASETEGENRTDIRNFLLQEFLSEFQKFTNERPGKPKKLLIYVNGGLTSIGAARNQAANQIRCMEEDGYFPAFLIWQTGPFKTYIEQVGKVRNGKISRNIQPTTPAYIAGDLGVGLARAPITFYNQTARYLDRLMFRDKDEYGVEGAGSMSHKHRLLKNSGDVSAEHNVIYPDGVDKGRSDIGGDLLYTITAPLRLVTTPFTDSLGKTAWENMLRRSRVTVRSAWEFQKEFYNKDKRTLGGKGEYSREELIKLYDKGTGAFSRFFQELDWCEKGKHGCKDNGYQTLLQKTEITVIGHSMGTIVLDQILGLFPKFEIDNIVYMAAASSPRSFLTRVGPYLRANKRTRFYSLMLHPLAEVRETTYGGLFPSGSLLEWIDDMFENPKTMIDRTFGKWRNVALTKGLFPPDIQDQMVFKIFGFRDGENSFNHEQYRPPDPVMHGHFNDTRTAFWRPKFWQPDTIKLIWRHKRRGEGPGG